MSLQDERCLQSEGIHVVEQGAVPEAPDSANWSGIQSVTVRRRRRTASVGDGQDTTGSQLPGGATPPPTAATPLDQKEDTPLLVAGGDAAVHSSTSRLWDVVVEFQERDEDTTEPISVGCLLPPERIEDLVLSNESMSSPPCRHQHQHQHHEGSSSSGWSSGSFAGFLASNKKLPGEATSQTTSPRPSFAVIKKEGDEDTEEIRIQFEKQDQGTSLAKLSWRGRWVFCKPLLLIGFSSLLSNGSQALYNPEVPFILQKYFGSSQAAARASTVSQAVRAAIGIVLSPVFGQLMDTVGRYPFLVIEAITGILPIAFFVAVPSQPLFAWLFNALSAMTPSVVYVYLADHYTMPRDRAWALGIYEGCLSAGQLASFFGLFASPSSLMWAGLLVAMIRLPFVLFCIEESLVKNDTPAAENKKTKDTSSVVKPVPPIKRALLFFRAIPKSLKAVWGNRVMRAAAFVSMALISATIGVSDILAYYWQATISLTPEENYLVSTESALVDPILLFCFYPILVKRVRPTRLSSLAGLMTVIIILLITFVKETWVIYVIPLSVGIQGMGFAPLTGIFSQAGTGESQGMRLEGLRALLEVVKTFVPLIIGQLFAVLPLSASWVPFIVTLAFVLPGLVFSLTLFPKWVAEDRQKALREVLQRQGEVKAGPLEA